MFAVLVLLVLLSILLFFSTYLKRQLFILFYVATRRQQFAVTLISLVLYPGVVVHELSHFITAVLLFVPIKSMTLVPKVMEGKIQGGSVMIQKVDVFRRTLVGIAPLFGGLVVLWLIVQFFVPAALINVVLELFSINFQVTNFQEVIVLVHPIFHTILIFYLLFSISSTMYSSQKDLEALLYTLPICIVAIVLLYIVGFQASWVVNLLERFEATFIALNVVLSLVLLTQVGVYVLLSVYSTFRKPIRLG